MGCLIAMTATAVSLPSHENSETVDFLRRLASMMSGGKNAEMLLGAAGIIEALTDRAVTAERLRSEQRDERERNSQLREAAEIATQNSSSEAAALRAQLADAVRRLRRREGRGRRAGLAVGPQQRDVADLALLDPVEQLLPVIA